jgi:hypothetical protein
MTAPPGVSIPTYYTQINAIQNAAGQPTNVIMANEGSVTVSGITDAPPEGGADGTSIQAYLFGYEAAAGVPSPTQTVYAVSNAVVGADLHQTDRDGNELYSWSVTLPTAGLGDGVYVLRSYINVGGIVSDGNGGYQVGNFSESDTGTVTAEEGLQYDNYIEHEDTEIVSVKTTDPETTVRIYNPDEQFQGPSSADITTDGRYVVYTDGDRFERDLQTGAVVDLTETGAAMVGTLAAWHGGSLGYNSATGNEYIIYSSFSAGTNTFSTISDFDHNPFDGGLNPLPTVTDATGATTVVGDFGSSPLYVGAAYEASDNGDALLSVDFSGVYYIPYLGNEPGQVADRQVYVTYLNPAPALHPHQGSDGTILFVDLGNGTAQLTGTSDAVGQQVEIDIGTAGANNAEATVAADGSWSATLDDLVLDGQTQAFVSVMGTDGTPALVSGAFVVAQTPPAPILTYPTVPQGENEITIVGTAPAFETITVYDTDGTVLGQGVSVPYFPPAGLFYVLTTTPLAEGIHSITATATVNGLTSAVSAPLLVDIDLTPPTAKVASLIVAGDDVLDLGEQVQPTMPVTGTLTAVLEAGASVIVTDPNGNQYTATVDSSGLSFSVDVPTAGGPETFSAYTVDEAGNQTAPLAQAVTVTPVNQITQLGTGDGQDLNLSTNGDYVAFGFNTSSYTGSDYHAYVADLRTGQTIDASGGFATTFGATLSGDGTEVAVEARIDGASTTTDQVELVNLATGTATLLSHADGDPTAPGDMSSEEARISEDGAHVVFDSTAADFSGDVSGISQVYEVDVADGTRRLISGTAAGIGDQGSSTPSVSSDGSVVVFLSQADNLVAGAPTDGSEQAYAATFDAEGNETIQLISGNASGVAADLGGAESVLVSGNGRYALFTAQADNLFAGAVAYTDELYRKDLETGALVLVSADAGGVAGSVDGIGSISDDGNVVAFSTSSTTLLGTNAPANGVDQVVTKNLATGVITIASGVGLRGADGFSENAAISGDGSVVAFESSAPDLVPGTPVGVDNSFISVPLATGPVITVPTLTLAPVSPGDLIGGPALAAGNVEISGTATDADGQTVRLVLTAAGSDILLGEATATVEAGAWSATLPSSDLAGEADGAYTIAADVSSAAGIAAPEVTETLTLDLTPPVVSITTPAGTTATAAPIIAGTGEPGTTLDLLDNGISLGGTVVSTDGTWSLAVTLPATGPQSLVATDTDAAGNVGDSAAVILTVASVAPVVTIAPFNGTDLLVGNLLTQNDSVVLTGTATDAAGQTIHVTYTQNGTTTPVGGAVVGQDGSWSIHIGTDLLGSLVQDGAGTFTATVANAAGTSSGTDVIAVHVAAPVVAFTDVANVSINPVVTGKGEPGTMITLTDSLPVFDQGTGVTTTTVTQRTATVKDDGTWSIVLAQPGDHSQDGTHTLTAADTDSYGNVGTTPTVTETLDTTPPNLLLGSVASIGLDMLYSISGTTDTFGQPVTVLDNGVVIGTVTDPEKTHFGVDVTLQQGPNIITLAQSDAHGNIATTAPDTVAVPYTPPALTLNLLGVNDVLSLAQVTAGGVVSGTSDQIFGTVTIGAYLYTAPGGYATSPGATVTAEVDEDGDWSTHLPPGLPGTMYELKATVSNGHVTTEADQFVTDDLIVPTITSSSVVAGGSTIPAGGTITVGQTVTIELNLNEQVDVNGSAPILLLSNGGDATYIGAIHAATDTLDFSYATLGPVTSDLRAVALTLPNGAVVVEASGVNQLAQVFDEDLGVAVARPRVVSSSVTLNGVTVPAGGSFAAGQTVTIVLNLSGVVTVAGQAPTLLLNNGEHATYTGPSNTTTSTLTFSYTPATGGTIDLRAEGVATPVGSAVLDASGTPPLGQFDQDLRVSVVPGISAVDLSGPGELDAPQTLTIGVTFTEGMFEAGSPPVLELSDGGRATYVSGAGTDRLVFSYAPAIGQHTADLQIVGFQNAPVDQFGLQAGGNLNRDLRISVGGLPPVVTGFTAALDPADHAVFTISFNKSVTGVTASAFRFETGSPADAAILSINAVPGSNNEKFTVVTSARSGDVTLDFTGVGVTDYAGDGLLEAGTVKSISAPAVPVTIKGVTGPIAAIGDFDGDGLPDLLYGEPEVRGVAYSFILYGMGDHQFSAPVSYNVPFTGPVTTADLSGNARSDVISSDFEGGLVGFPSVVSFAGRTVNFTDVGGASTAYGVAAAGTINTLIGLPSLAVAGSPRYLVTQGVNTDGYQPPSPDDFAGLTKYTLAPNNRPGDYQGPITFYDQSLVTLFFGNGAGGYTQFATIETHQLVQWLGFLQNNVIVVGPGDPTFTNGTSDAAVDEDTYNFVGDTVSPEWLTIYAEPIGGSSNLLVPSVRVALGLPGIVPVDEYGGGVIGDATPLVATGNLDATVTGLSGADAIVATVQGSEFLVVAQTGVDLLFDQGPNSTDMHAQHLQLDGYAQSIAMGDLYGDGDDEVLVVVSHDKGNDTLETFSGKTGTLQFVSSVAIDGAGAIEVQTADLNGDGRADIILSGFTGANAPSFEEILSDQVYQAAVVVPVHSTVVFDSDGKAADGYIAGATVFDDANGNGVLDPGEAFTTTDADGNYAIPAGSGPLVLTGGTDIDTGLAFTGTLTAPAGAAAVTPLTTLVQKLAATNGGDTAAAEAAVVSAFGLAAGTDLASLDPIAAALAGNTAAFAAGAVAIDTATLIGAAGGADVFDAMAAQIAALPTGAILGLADAGTLAALATTSGVPDAVIASVAAIAAAGNDLVAQEALADGGDPTRLLVDVTAVSIATQGGAATALAQAGTDPDALPAVVTGFTGANLASAAQADTASVGSFAPEVSDQSGTLVGTVSGTITVSVPGATLDGTATPPSGVGATGEVDVPSGADLTLIGPISNAGTIALLGDSVSGPALLTISGGVTLSGGGTVTLRDTNTGVFGDAARIVGSGGTLENLDNTISGYGELGGDSVGFSNDAAGTVVATVGTLTLDSGTSTIVNAGLLASDEGGSLILGSAVRNSGTLRVGGTTSIMASGTVTNSGEIRLVGGPFLAATYGAATTVNTGLIDGAGTVAGPVTGLGTIEATGGTLTLTGNVSGVLQIASDGTLGLQGNSVSPTGAVTIDAGGGVTGFGTITGPETNNGAITATGGTLDVVGDVTGGGTLNLDQGGVLQLDGTVAASQSLVFTNGDETLALGLDADILASISGVLSGDMIGLVDQQVISAIYTPANQQLAITGDGGSMFELSFVGDYQQSNFQVVNDEVAVLLCFLHGTHIATPRGEVPVETLTIGDVVNTHQSGQATVRWIGYRDVDCRRHSKPETVWPVRVAKGAFGENLPHRDLWLSPDHAVYVENVLIPVRYLINGTTVARIPREHASYYHVELETHDLLTAEGLLAESYLDTGDRANFANCGATIRLFADFTQGSRNVAALWEAFGCAPLIISGPSLDAARARVSTRTSFKHQPTPIRHRE